MNDPDKPVPRRSLDAIFRHVITPDEALKQRLRDAGYDLDNPEPLYSVQTHKRSLAIAREHLFPSESVPDGYRKLGRLWANGFAQTVVGSVLAAAAKVIGIERVLARVPSYMKTGRADLMVEVMAVGPRLWRMQFTDSQQPLPYLSAGVVEGIVAMTGSTAIEVTVESETATGFELEIRWAA